MKSVKFISTHTPLVLNDGTEWRPSAALVAEYVRLYPGVDVKQQFNEMRAWCLSNPKKRKTHRGIKRFVNSWLSGEQDKASRVRRYPADNRKTSTADYMQQTSGWYKESEGGDKNVAR